MTPDIDDDNLDSYNSDDFERGLKPCKVKISEHNKRPKFLQTLKRFMKNEKEIMPLVHKLLYAE